VVEAWREAPPAVVDHCPVLLVSIGVADECVQHQVAHEPLPGSQVGLTCRRLNLFEHRANGAERVPPSILRMLRTDAELREEFVAVHQALPFTDDHAADDPWPGELTVVDDGQLDVRCGNPELTSHLGHDALSPVVSLLVRAGRRRVLRCPLEQPQLLVRVDQPALRLRPQLLVRRIRPG
jgi:hypothetical protein